MMMWVMNCSGDGDDDEDDEDEEEEEKKKNCDGSDDNSVAGD